MPLIPEKLKNCSPYKLNEWIAPKSFWAWKNYLLNRFLAKFRVSNGQSCQNSAQTRTPHGLNGMNTKNPNPEICPLKKKKHSWTLSQCVIGLKLFQQDGWKTFTVLQNHSKPKKLQTPTKIYQNYHGDFYPVLKEKNLGWEYPIKHF